MAPEEKKRIHEALTVCNGDRQQAADMLHITKVRLSQLIRVTKDLRMAWTIFRKPKPVENQQTQAVAKRPPQTISELLGEDSAVKEAREEAEFRQLLEAVGHRSGEIVQALALQRMYGNHTMRSVNYIGGSLMMRAGKIIRRLEELDGQLTQGFTGEHAAQELQICSTTYIELHHVLTKLLEVGNQTIASREKLKIYQQQAKGGANRGKAGWGPKRTNIIAQNVAVKI